MIFRSFYENLPRSCLGAVKSTLLNISIIFISSEVFAKFTFLLGKTFSFDPSTSSMERFIDRDTAPAAADDDAEDDANVDVDFDDDDDDDESEAIQSAISVFS